jgi:hypothetical protein
VSLKLDFGSYELGAEECRELIRCLHRRSERTDDVAALASARYLEGLRDARAGVDHVTEEELDAIADAAWDWLQNAGSDALPERVLLVLDALRSRHAHE